jgi:hypothetical protein
MRLLLLLGLSVLVCGCIGEVAPPKPFVSSMTTTTEEPFRYIEPDYLRPTTTSTTTSSTTLKSTSTTTTSTSSTTTSSTVNPYDRLFKKAVARQPGVAILNPTSVNAGDNYKPTTTSIEGITGLHNNTYHISECNGFMSFGGCGIGNGTVSVVMNH